MKKFYYIFLLTGFLFFMHDLSPAQDSSKAMSREKIKVVATTFPIYDYIREIVGQSETFDLSLLVDNGIDLHNFQPSASDIADISNADLFIYNGGDSDVWVQEVLEQALNKDMKIINLMSGLGARLKVEELVDGMEEANHEGHAHAKNIHKEHEHDHKEHEHEGHKHGHEGHEHGHAEHVVYDEHVWLSLINSMLMIEEISQKLQAIDTANASLYAKNTSVYVQKLQALHEKYTALFKQSKRNTVIFADRFPFRYLVDDYGINYYAAFPGCSAETEASFDTVIFLANKIDELAINKLLIIDDVSKKLAQAIVRTSEKRNAESLKLNSLQTVTQKELAEGISYFTVMQNNLQTLYKALH